MFLKQKQYFFDNNHCHEYYQFRCALIGNKWDCRLYDGFGFKYAFGEFPNIILFYDTPIKLSEIMLACKMVSSKTQFKNLLRGKGIKFQRSWNSKEETLEIDTYVNLDGDNESLIVCGQRYLEIVTPRVIGWRKGLAYILKSRKLLFLNKIIDKYLNAPP